MSSFIEKISSHWKNILVFIGSFVLIFAALIYIFIWKSNPAPQSVSGNSSSQSSLNLNPELKNRLAADISYLNYEEWADMHNVASSDRNYDSDLDNDGLPNYLEYAFGTDPKNPDTDGDKYTDRQEVINGYDPDAPGDIQPITEISISKIGVKVPMVWSKSTDEKNVMSDLEKGASHYPKTASPGQTGNMIVSGHSSNVIWALGNYNNIFQNLNNLGIGDEVKVKTIQRNGRVLIYHYKVTEKRTVAADDPYIFENTANPTMTLSTCWPLGTAWKRLIVKAELQ